MAEDKAKNTREDRGLTPVSVIETEDVKELIQGQRETREIFEENLTLAKKILTSITSAYDSKAEFKKPGDITRDLSTILNKGIRDLGKEYVAATSGILMSKEDYSAKAAAQDISRVGIESMIGRVNSEISPKLAKLASEYLKGPDSKTEKALDDYINSLSSSGKLKPIAEGLLQAIKIYKESGDITERRFEQSQEAEQIVSSPGLSFLTGATKFLGLGSLSSVLESYISAAKQAATSTLATTGDKDAAIKAAKIELSGIGEGLFKLLKASVVLIARSLWKSFTEVDKAAAELKRTIGSWEIPAAGANFEFASSVDYLTAANDLAKSLGVNYKGIISENTVAQVAEIKNLTGITADQANNLAIRSQLTRKSADQYRDSLTRGANAMNGLNGTAINLKAVQDDVLNTSNATALSLGNSAEALGRAATSAAALGLNLKDVDAISDKLLNFESSISNEMTAQLLTGHQLNLSKARALALDNDLEGVAQEILDQNITAGDFTRMNKIQQEGIAKALGMSREELAKSLVLQQLHNGASTEALAAATSMTAKQIEAMSASERWQKSVEKLKQSFAPLLVPLANILDLVSTIVTKFAGLIGMLNNLGPKGDNTGDRRTGGLLGGLLGIGGLVAAVALIKNVVASLMVSRPGIRFLAASRRTFRTAGQAVGGFFKGLGQGFTSIAKGLAVAAGITAIIAGIGGALKLFEGTTPLKTLSSLAAGMTVFAASLLLIGTAVSTGPGAIAMGLGLVTFSLIARNAVLLGGGLFLAGKGMKDFVASASGIGSAVSAIASLTIALDKLDLTKVNALGRVGKIFRSGRLSVEAESINIGNTVDKGKDNEVLTMKDVVKSLNNIEKTLGSEIVLNVNGERIIATIAKGAR